jgi:isoleucyl-tRNA synthetase
VVFEKYGADALRAYMLSAPVMQAENMNFSEKGVEEALRKNVMLLWNVYSFYQMYATETSEEKIFSVNVLDKWIIAKLNQLIETVTKSMNEYDLPRSMRPITEFIDEFSTWYLRRSRDRFKVDPRLREDRREDKQAALATMKFVFIELAKVMAPFMPFTAEALWQKASGFEFVNPKASVHLEHWPTANTADEEIITQMGTVRRIVEMGLAARDAAKMKIRQPLQKITVSRIKLDSKELIALITDELNVKEVIFIDGAEEKVELDTAITPELEREGLKREVVRLINGMRKEKGLTIKDRISLAWSSDDEVVKQTMEQYVEDIKADVLADTLVMEKVEEMVENKVNNKVLLLSINKV